MSHIRVDFRVLCGILDKINCGFSTSGESNQNLDIYFNLKYLVINFNFNIFSLTQYDSLISKLVAK